MRLPNGDWITLPRASRFGTEVFITDANVDWGSEKLLNSLISAGGVFLDVGANIGYYSLYVKPKVTFVYSFEPDPRSLGGLAQNAGSNMEIIPCAVGAVEGKSHFVLGFDPELSHLSADKGGENEIEVEVITLDAFVASRRLKVSAIKIDVEGYDRQVLEGGVTTLMEQKPIVLAECFPDAELFKLMTNLCYRVFAYVRQPETRKISFVELLDGVQTQGETKMLFLIPNHRASDISRQAN